MIEFWPSDSKFPSSTQGDISCFFLFLPREFQVSLFESQKNLLFMTDMNPLTVLEAKFELVHSFMIQLCEKNCVCLA